MCATFLGILLYLYVQPSLILFTTQSSAKYALELKRNLHRWIFHKVFYVMDESIRGPIDEMNANILHGCRHFSQKSHAGLSGIVLDGSPG